MDVNAPTIRDLVRRLSNMRKTAHRWHRLYDEQEGITQARTEQRDGAVENYRNAQKELKRIRSLLEDARKAAHAAREQERRVPKENKALKEELESAKKLIETISAMPMRDAVRVAELKDVLKTKEYELHKLQTKVRVIEEALQGLTEGLPEYEAPAVYDDGPF